MNDNDALLAIQALMDGVEWSPSTLDRIAAILNNAGYRVRDLDEKDSAAIDECANCGTTLSEHCGKPLGCYECNALFCSSDCLASHEKATGHREKL